MRLYTLKQIREAKAHSMAGGQALHMFSGENWAPGKKIPSVFRRHKLWAHLLDQDRERLEATARRLGVRVIVVGRPGEPGQHIDLCGAPLTRAVKICEMEEDAHAASKPTED